MSLLLVGHSRHCRVAIIITQFLADNLHYNTLLKIYQQPQATWGGLIRFCNGIENCPGNEDYLTWSSCYCNVMQWRIAGYSILSKIM